MIYEKNTDVRLLTLMVV